MGLSPEVAVQLKYRTEFQKSAAFLNIKRDFFTPLSTVSHGVPSLTHRFGNISGFDRHLLAGEWSTRKIMSYPGSEAVAQLLCVDLKGSVDIVAVQLVLNDFDADLPRLTGTQLFGVRLVELGSSASRASGVELHAVD